LIKRVAQRGDMDCSVAAVAMALDMTYEEALAALPEGVAETGMYCGSILAWMRKRGLPAMIISKRTHKAAWPPAPTADAHVCEVAGRPRSLMGHFVFMDRTGRVLDPAREGEFRLQDYDAWRVCAVWPREEEDDD
jgi:hypothetical protein